MSVVQGSTHDSSRIVRILEPHFSRTIAITIHFIRFSTTLALSKVKTKRKSPRKFLSNFCKDPELSSYVCGLLEAMDMVCSLYLYLHFFLFLLSFLYMSLCICYPRAVGGYLESTQAMRQEAIRVWHNGGKAHGGAYGGKCGCEPLGGTMANGAWNHGRSVHRFQH